MNSMTSSPPQRSVPPARQTAPEEIQPTAKRSPHRRRERFGSVGYLLFNIIIPIGILALGGLAWWAFGEQQPAVRPADDTSYAALLERIPAVETLPIRSLDAVGGRLDLEVDGVVVPFREVQIATEVSGTIVFKAPECEAGTFVEEGQLLIRIDPSDYQNEIDRLTQLKEQEYQAIRELDQQLVNTNRLLEVARQDVALQEREVDRLEKLPAGYASAAEIDQAKRARLQAVNARVQLENELDLMQRRRSRLEAAEKLAESQLRLAQANLARTEIRSPVSGVVYREDAELNSFAQRGEVIVTLEDTSKAEVAVNLRTDQLYWVLDQARRGSGELMPAADGSARSYSLPATEATILYQVAGRENEIYRWEGVLERYDGIGFDAVSRTVPVRIVVDEPRRYQVGAADGKTASASSGPSALVRGMFVTVILHVEPKRNLVVVPAVGLKPGNRVWKFVPDPSVVAASGGAASGGAPTGATPVAEAAAAANETPEAGTVEKDVAAKAAAEPAKVAATADEELDRFDPEQWVAGRLEVLENLRPIQASHLVAGAQAQGASGGREQGKPDFWVCEVGQGELIAGSRIVVSPLPSFEGQGTDYVRVPAEQITGTAEEIAVRSPAGLPPRTR
ncbi:efflux RND transporter periplasmic adaptor subunit [Candidatus Laterigemmans baculatus]|uniref:efflux RND transporter periplasmic adaptor subunit n=1 Tax=Candidatus Laterigemmans baculatus TaxID=2770505 RepID=UPI0013D9092A|nr:HlyD family efflux transporter periplasmic adaptor subunit [Candidatus Laterigemmans baculatus]